MFNLAHAHQNLGHVTEAESCFADCVERFERTLGDEHAYAGAARSGLAHLLVEESRHTEAEPLLLKTAELVIEDPDAPDRLKARAIEPLVEFYEEWGRQEQAEAWRVRLP